MSTASAAGVKILGAPESFRLPVPTARGIATSDKSVVLRADGTVVGSFGMVKQMRNIVDVSRGNGFTVGLRNNGTVQVVADQGELKTALRPPAEAVEIVAISAGSNYVLGLRRDGTVVTWGEASEQVLVVPLSLKRVVAISAGATHCVALRSDGKVIAWGDNSFRQTDVPVSLENVTAIAAGGFHNLALQADGKVVAWGRNDAGQTRIPQWEGRALQIAAGRLHSVALLENGNRVVAWGSNARGQASVPNDLINVVAVAAGDLRSVALRRSGPLPSNLPSSLTGGLLDQPYAGTIKVEGRNVRYWASGLPDGLKVNPKNGLITGIPKETGHFTVRVRARNANGDVSRLLPMIVSGDNSPRKIMLSPTIVDEGQPAGTVVGRLSAEDPDVREILTFEVLPAVGAQTPPLFTVVDDNELRTTARLDYEVTPVCHVRIRVTDSYGLTAESSIPITVRNRQLDEDEDGLSDDLEARYKTSDQRSDSDGDGASDREEILAGTNPTDPGSLSPRVVVWGNGAASNPAHIPANLGKVKQVLTFSYFAAALRENGSVSVWTAPPFSPQSLTPPNLIPDVNGLIEIAGDGSSLIGLRSDGSLDRVTTNAPQVPDLKDVVAIAGGSQEYLALRSNGQVVVWATGSSQKPVPDKVRDVVAIAAGHGSRMALKADGSVVSWNNSGLVAIPETVNNVVAIASRDELNQVLKADGSTVAWGSNASELQLPTPPSPYVALVASSSTSAGLTADGRVVMAAASIAGIPMPTGLRKNVTQLSGAHRSFIAIAAGPLFPRITRSASITGRIGAALVYNPQITGTASNFSAMGLLAGLSIDAQTGAITGTPTAAGAFSVRVMATNVSGTGHQILHFRIAAGDHSPSGITLNNSAVLENKPVGTFVGTLASADADTNDVFAYSLVPGIGDENNSLFHVVGDQLQTKAAFDFETKANYTIRVRTTDAAGLQFEQTLTISVVNVTNEDSDQDGLTEANEVAIGTSDLDPDFDDDGVSDGEEVSAGDDPKDSTSFPSNIVAWGPLQPSNYAPPVTLKSPVAIAAQANQSLALSYDGTVMGWGIFPSSKITAPMDLNDAVQISAGVFDAGALRANGTVVTWKHSAAVEPAVKPSADLKDVVSISIGYEHALALKADSTVVAFGQNTSGACDVPALLRDVVAVQAGISTSAALTRDGRIVTWGAPVVVPPELQGRARAIRLRSSTLMGIRDDGKVFVSGGLVPAELTDVAQIEINSYHTAFLARKVDGTAVEWLASARQTMITPPPQARDLVGIAFGSEHRLGLRVAPAPRLTSSEEIVGTINQPLRHQVTAEHANLFSAVCLPAGFTLDPTTGVLSGTPTQAGTFRTLLVARNTQRKTMVTQMLCIRVGAGANAPSELRLEPGEIFENQPVGSSVGTLTTVDPDAGDYFEYSLVSGEGATDNDAFRIDGTLLKSTRSFDFETKASYSIRVRTTDIARLSREQVIVAKVRNIDDEDGDGLTETQEAQLGTSDSDRDSDDDFAMDGDEVAAGTDPSNPASTSPAVVVWGSSSFGQLNVPAGLYDPLQISAGIHHCLALKKNGTVVAWGYNTRGQATVPAGLENVVAIAAGGWHSLALRQDGTVVAWGNNEWGESTVPASLKNVIAIAAGQDFSLALLGNGTVAQWGQSLGGEPFSSSLQDVVGISAGWHNPIALKADGTIKVWGTSWFNMTTPPTSAKNVVIAGAGEIHGAYLKADGTATIWGGGSGGWTYPIEGLPLTPTDLVDLSVGARFTLGIRSNGTVIGWGDNYHGQTTIPPGLTNVVSIAAGGYHSMAIKAQPAPPQFDIARSCTGIAGAPFSQQLVVTGTATGYSALSLPPGLAIDPNTGLISGTPTQSGTFYTRLIVRGNTGADSLIVRFTIAP